MWDYELIFVVIPSFSKSVVISISAYLTLSLSADTGNELFFMTIMFKKIKNCRGCKATIEISTSVYQLAIDVDASLVEI